MSSPVKPRRRYDSSGRQEQARRNRRAVLQAARQLFLERGFAATTMPAIASAAGVSVQTVYKAFGNKPRLAKALFDVAMAGDDEPVPMLQRASLERVRTEPDPRTKLRLYGEFLAEVAPRHVPSSSSYATRRPTIRRPAPCGPNSKPNDSRA
ncbi:MAG: TetR/AcrR family transcriptional regulator [Acidimicrobiales bacterium]